ncbi:amino acid ABC transporter substrate-binding protein, partial [Mesorhizobium sp. M7D.F.Ca.US.004.03.1.1]|uniref:substrate-binding periplasmic protein n=1 Tax=Mesorhizobium sp. M7D.F.Ca.US.004.03.1.1 TaxID=2496702 RepID=UPI000FD3C1DB
MNMLHTAALSVLVAFASTACLAQDSKPAQTAPLTFTSYPKPWPFRALVTPGKLTIAVTPDSPPGTYVNMETGQVDGWAVAIWKQIGADLGLEVELVTVDWASVLPGIASNRFDLGCAGAAWTKERLTSPDLLLTNPIVVTSTVAITRKDSGINSWEATEGKRMGGTRGEVYFEQAKSALTKVAEAVEFPGSNEALLALVNGQVDFVMMNKGSSTFALTQFPQADQLAMVSTKPLAAFPESLCVNPRETDLLTAMNILLGNYRATGQLAGWFKQYAKSTGSS